MFKKFITTILLIFSLIFGLGISAALYDIISKGRQHDDTIILIIAIIPITIICVYLFKLFIKKKEPRKAPENYKPFIIWKYDSFFWKQFKELEYKIYLKERIKTILFVYLMFFVFSGIPIMLYMNFSSTIFFLGYGIWGVLMSVVGIIIYENEYYLKIKNKHLNSREPIITLNSYGFTINDEYINLNLSNTECVETNLCLKDINGILCISYYISKKFTTVSNETGDDIEHYETKNFNIPIPINKKDELQKFLIILEHNRGIKIKTELLDN